MLLCLEKKYICENPILMEVLEINLAYVSDLLHELRVGHESPFSRHNSISIICLNNDLSKGIAEKIKDVAENSCNVPVNIQKLDMVPKEGIRLEKDGYYPKMYIGFR